MIAIVHLSTDKYISKASLIEFFEPKQIKKYEDRYDELHYAIKNSDYVVTAWEDGRLIGILRSSGDNTFTQYINNFLIHDAYVSRGIASKMLNLYLQETEDVDDVYIISGRKVTKSFTINWYLHKGFEQITSLDNFHVFRRSKQ